MIDAAGGVLAVALRFVAVTATTGALGAWVFYRLVLPRLPGAFDDAARMAWRGLAVRVALVCLFALMLSALARLQVPDSVLPPVVGATGGATQGTGSRPALLAQFTVAVLGSMMITFSWRRGSWHALAADACLVALALIAPALAHAGVSPELRIVAYTVDFAHGAAAGAWVGALALLTVLVRRERVHPDGAARSAALFAAFHPVALVAAPTVFVTGLATAWLRMGVPEGIANSTYSGLFVAKLLLAGVVGYFGAGHSKLVTRRMAVVTPGAVGRTLAAEVAFALVVLIITAVLVGTPPIG